jgi:hypothetical protein
MGRLLLLSLLLVGVAIVVPAKAAPKMSFGACKTKVMQDSRNLDGPGRNYCGRGCLVKVRACVRGAA